MRLLPLMYLVACTTEKAPVDTADTGLPVQESAPVESVPPDSTPPEDSTPVDSAPQDSDPPDTGDPPAPSLLDGGSLADAPVIIDGLAYQDLAGFAVAGVGDLNGDGLMEAAIGVPGSDLVEEYGGAVAILSGPTPLGGSYDEAGTLILGERPADFAGMALAGADLDGDGYGDVLVGAPYSMAVRTALQAGAVYRVSGPIEGHVGLTSAGAMVTGERESDYVGLAVQGTGDLDGDGGPDVLVGAPHADIDGIVDLGAVYVVSGAWSDRDSLSDAYAVWQGETDDDRMGWAVVSGDLDADGVQDLAVSSYYQDEAGEDSGKIYVSLNASDPGVHHVLDADGRWTGEGAGDGAGWQMTTADLDGDGHLELLAGAEGVTATPASAGVVYIIDASTGGDWSLADTTDRIVGPAVGVGARSPVAADLDGDGAPELIIGATGDDTAGEDAGAIYLLQGPFGGTQSLAGAAAWTGAVAGDAAGRALAAPGDVDGDGLGDLLTGCYQAAPSGEQSGQAALLLSGSL